MAKLTYEGALQQQKEAKAAVKEAKTALTDYYKANKLKRNEDYSGDKKHGKKIASLEKEVKKSSATLANINEKVEALKDGGGKTKKAKGTGATRQKYDYPADCDTPAKKKKYRQMMRDQKAGKVKKEKKAKVEKETKTSKKAKAETPEKATKKTKVAKRTADKKAEKKTSSKKTKSRKAKSEDD